MADLIDRQAALNLFPSDALEWDTYDGYIAPHLARRMINELPSAQPDLSLKQVLEYCRSRCITAVEDEVLYKRLDSAYTEGYTAAESKYRAMWDEMPKIILCKDCKYADKYCNCSYTTWWNSPNDFCSKGERRTDEGD